MNKPYSKGDLVDASLLDIARQHFYIYKITNKKTNKFYIGQARDLLGRLRTHKLEKKRELGNYRHWIIEVLEVVTLQTPTTDRHVPQVMELEMLHIREGLASNPKKCVNTIGRRGADLRKAQPTRFYWRERKAA